MDETTYKQSITILVDSYGDISSVPREAIWRLQEQLRAHYIIAANTDDDKMAALRRHGVPINIIEVVLGETPESHQRRQKRSDKYQAMIDWCLDHPLEQTSAEALAAVGEVSYPTALKFINDRIDLFRKIKRGIYEVRDVKTERASAK